MITYLFTCNIQLLNFLCSISQQCCIQGHQLFSLVTEKLLRISIPLAELCKGDPLPQKDPNFFIFMHFSGKIGKQQIGANRLGKLGSAPVLCRAIEKETLHLSVQHYLSYFNNGVVWSFCGIRYHHNIIVCLSIHLPCHSF